MRTEEIRYDSRDGKTKLYAVRFIPDGEVKAVLQLIHGMAEHIGRYAHVAEWFTQRGILVTGEDHLGHGRSVPEGGTKGYFCEQDPATVAVRDVHRLKKMTQEAYPGVPYFILGHSMGSLILRNYLYRYGTGIKGAVICGTASQAPIMVKTGLMIANLQSVFTKEKGKHKAYFLNSLAFGDPKKKEPGHINDWLCTDPNVVKKYDEDPDCGYLFTVNGFKTLLTIVDRNNDKKNVEKIPKDLPIMIISGKEDSVGDFGKGVTKVFEEYKDLGIENVECKLYDGLRHEILNEITKEEVYKDIYDWMMKNM